MLECQFFDWHLLSFYHLLYYHLRTCTSVKRGISLPTKAISQSVPVFCSDGKMLGNSSKTLLLPKYANPQIYRPLQNFALTEQVENPIASTLMLPELIFTFAMS